MANKGICTICGAAGKLTDDHVPPKSVVRPTRLEVRRLADALRSGSEMSPRDRRAFASPIFQTICAECNGGRLGKLYDPALTRFANGLAAWLRANAELGLSLPPRATVRIQPALVTRAVFGHLLASESARSSKAAMPSGTMSLAMREYFLSDDLPLPSTLRLLVWPFAGNNILIGRGIGYRDLRQRTAIVLDVLKFFPVAFAVLSVDPDTPIPDVTYVRPESVTAIDGETEIDIPMRGAPHADWPEHPSDSSIVLLHGPSVIIARRAS